MVLLNQITGRILIKLYIICDIINKVDNCYKKSNKVADLMLGNLEILWLNDFPPPVMLYFSIILKFYHPYIWSVNKKGKIQ